MFGERFRSRCYIIVYWLMRTISMAVQLPIVLFWLTVRHCLGSDTTVSVGHEGQVGLQEPNAPHGATVQVHMDEEGTILKPAGLLRTERGGVQAHAFALSERTVCNASSDCNNQQVTDAVCINHACCAANVRCGVTCGCMPHEVCVGYSSDRSNMACCPDNSRCGHACGCSASEGETCCNGVCCGKTSFSTCLPTGKADGSPLCCPLVSLCGSQCGCPSNTTCIDGQCCPSQNICGGVCCPGICMASVAGRIRVCCPNADQVCGNVCCPAGNSCQDPMMGTCCPSKCGTSCCASNQVCDNPSTSTCVR